MRGLSQTEEYTLAVAISGIRCHLGSEYWPALQALQIRSLLVGESCPNCDQCFCREVGHLHYAPTSLGKQTLHYVKLARKELDLGSFS